MSPRSVSRLCPVPFFVSRVRPDPLGPHFLSGLPTGTPSRSSSRVHLDLSLNNYETTTVLWQPSQGGWTTPFLWSFPFHEERRGEVEGIGIPSPFVPLNGDPDVDREKGFGLLENVLVEYSVDGK